MATITGNYIYSGYNNFVMEKNIKDGDLSLLVNGAELDSSKYSIDGNIILLNSNSGLSTGDVIDISYTYDENIYTPSLSLEEVLANINDIDTPEELLRILTAYYDAINGNTELFNNFFIKQYTNDVIKPIIENSSDYNTVSTIVSSFKSRFNFDILDNVVGYSMLDGYSNVVNSYSTSLKYDIGVLKTLSRDNVSIDTFGDSLFSYYDGYIYCIVGTVGTGIYEILRRNIMLKINIETLAIEKEYLNIRDISTDLENFTNVAIYENKMFISGDYWNDNGGTEHETPPMTRVCRIDPDTEELLYSFQFYDEDGIVNSDFIYSIKAFGGYLYIETHSGGYQNKLLYKVSIEDIENQYNTNGTVANISYYSYIHNTYYRGNTYNIRGDKLFFVSNNDNGEFSLFSYDGATSENEPTYTGSVQIDLLDISGKYNDTSVYLSDDEVYIYISVSQDYSSFETYEVVYDIDLTEQKSVRKLSGTDYKKLIPTGNNIFNDKYNVIFDSFGNVFDLNGNKTISNTDVGYSPFLIISYADTIVNGVLYTRPRYEDSDKIMAYIKLSEPNIG